MSTISHLIPLLAAALVSAIWQSALLALCVATSLRLLPGVTAAARSVLWTGVFLLMILLPFAHLYPVNSSATDTSRFHAPSAWAFAVMGVWALLSLLRAARLLHSAFRLYGIATRATLIVPSDDIAEALCVGDKTSVRLCTSREVDVPSVAGFLHPRILMPPALLETISPSDLRQIVLHEVEHLRRHDDWTNLLQKLGLAIFPLNPILLWVERRLCVERELACDDGVLDASGSAKAYATCLANLAEASLLRRGLSLALGAWQRQSELARRVHRILRNPRREMSRVQATTLAALMFAATAGTGFVAERTPQLIDFDHASASSPSDAAYTAPLATASFHPTLVKVVMPQARPAPTSVSTLRKPARRASHTSRATLSNHRRAQNSTPNIVLIGWQPSGVHPHWAFAVSQDSHFAYAAVPTRNGWFFIQL